MFYRFTQHGARIPVDLDGLYEGETLFVLGGSPLLNTLPLALLKQDGLITLGVNNVPCVFKPSLWISADGPRCFSSHIHALPEVLKFTPISRRDNEVGGRRLSQFPSYFFFGTRESFTAANFLDPHSDFAWWRSVFPLALQLAWRLGFRRVFLVGCGFVMSKDPGQQYAWPTCLTPDQVDYSQQTYSKDLVRLKNLLPTFEQRGFEVVSSTPGSAANGLLPFVPLEEAVQRALANRLPLTDTAALPHSSNLQLTPAGATP